MIAASARFAALAALVAGLGIPAAAQAPAEGRRPIVTAGDAAILGTSAIGSLVLIGWDRQISSRVRASPLHENGVVRTGMDVAGFAGDPGALIAGAGLWASGRFGKNRTRELVGLRAVEAIVLSGSLTVALKAIGGRARPDRSPGAPRDFVLGRGFGDRSEFQSFPSGHATAAFAFASAVDAELDRLAPRRPAWLVPLLYGIAAGTAVSRVYHDRHWTSDIVLGSAIGFVGGRAVVRWHADPEVNGIFVTVELEGALAARIHDVQMRHDPKLAREFPPHVTLLGSSGAGPISADTPHDVLERAILGVTDRTPPLAARFEPAIRFIGREIVVLPLSPHGAIRGLHEALKMSGLSFQSARWPFTPHCTLNYYATLTPARLAALLAVREPDPWEIRTLRVYHTRDDQRADLLFDAPLRGSRSPGPGDRAGGEEPLRKLSL